MHTVESGTRRLCVLMASHNRKQLTLRCLESLFSQEPRDAFAIKAILVDDGSTDGTTIAVKSRFPEVQVLVGDGSLFWNRAMHMACEEALRSQCEMVLWLNDDVALYPNALRKLFDAHHALGGEAVAGPIIVGALQDPSTLLLSYSGWRSRNGWNPADCVKCEPSDVPVQCDTLNGNCVLMSRGALEIIGNLDKRFHHSMGDFDFGFRSRRAGCQIWIAPGFVGECRINEGVGLWTDRLLPWTDRLRKLLGPKGLPPAEWLVFTSRHSGPLWIGFWLYPYLKFGVQGLTSLFRGARR